MIRILKPAGSEPAILQTKGVAARQALENAYDAGTQDFSSKDYDAGIYGHRQVKDKLIKLQSYKCCFCEAKIGHISYGDVEHFRPKAGWVQSTEPINQPGYYWLAYDWDNLFLSCQICNQQFKKNFFPLQNPANRATSHHKAVSNEAPIFIHLSNEDPEDFIAFSEEVPHAINGNKRGTETIINTGIDRDDLSEDRQKTLALIRHLYNIAKNHPATPPKLKADAVNVVKGYYHDSQLDSTEYASMLRCFFKANPITAL